MILFIISLIVIILLGVLISIWLTKTFSVLHIGLGIILGLGIFGIEYILLNKILLAGLQFIFLLNILSIGLLLFLIKRTVVKNLFPKKLLPIDPFRKALSLVTLTSVVAFFILLIFISVYHPYGQWDAWMMWNTKGIHLAHYDLLTFLNESLPSISHPSYPLLLPSILAHSFDIFDANSTVIPILVSLLFCLSAILIVWGGTYILSQENLFTSYFSLLCLIISPFFLLESISQYADIPLSIYLLSCFIIIIMAYDYKNSKMFILCGVLLGLLVLLKNEGLLVSGAVFFVWLFYTKINPAWTFKGLLISLSVFLPFFFTLIYFKTLNVSQDHLNAMDFSLSGIVNQASQNLFDVFSYYLKTLFKFTEVIILVLAISLLKNFNTCFNLSNRSFFVLFSITVILTGYTVIYLLTPNIDFLLSASAKRLFLHVFPSLILLIGISFNSRNSRS